MAASEDWRPMMYAIVRMGGRQYRAEVGALIDVERLPNEMGEIVELEEVLLIADEDQTAIGQPLVEDARVQATVVGQSRGEKIVVWKYIPKERYRRKQGHRQYYTRLRIDKISSA
jgi:large subunit ribosomal protein L21